MKALNKQALIAKIKKQTESFDTVVLKEDEANALLDELEALQSFRTAFNEWHDKTEWVQGDKRFDVIKPWGKHRADVLKLYIDHLESKLEAAEKTSAARLEAIDRAHKMFQREKDRAEAAEKRIAELECSETQLINERDDAESALNDAYKAVMGQTPEWSNWFSFADAIDEVELACRLWRNQTEDVIQFRQRIAELESRTVTLPDERFRYGESDYDDGFVNGWNAHGIETKTALRAAGIGVKGE